MIKIRNQIESDADTVKTIVSAATNELRSVYKPVTTKAQDKNVKPICVVAIINGEVVGLTEYIIYKNSILIRGLAVSPHHRRQGVAKAIIEYVTLLAKKEGKSQLALSTIKETGNIKVFLHMGFTIDSEEISEIFKSVQGEHVTVVNMSKKWHNKSLNRIGAKNAPPG